LELSNTYNLHVVCQLFAGISSKVIDVVVVDVSHNMMPSLGNRFTAPDTTRDMFGYGEEFNIFIEEI
jgi:hypothetical protein